jgi:hypothetical protein
LHDDEVRIGDVNVETDRREKKPRQPADREEADEANSNFWPKITNTVEIHAS